MKFFGKLGVHVSNLRTLDQREGQGLRSWAARAWVPMLPFRFCHQEKCANCPFLSFILLVIFTAHTDHIPVGSWSRYPGILVLFTLLPLPALPVSWSHSHFQKG